MMNRLSSLLKANRYVALSQDPPTSESLEKLLPPTSQEQNVKSGVLLTWRRAACLLVSWLLTSLIAGLWFKMVMSHPGQCGVGLKHLELKAADSWIEEQIVKFTGTPIFEEGDVAYREYDPNVTQYIGNSSDVDDAWHELLRNRYFLADEEEMRAIYPDNYQQYYHNAVGWWIGLDGFHILHCVNVVRLALNELRGGTVNNTSFQRYHEDHCIDLIRQSVQCNLDLTPVPERRWPSKPHFIDSNQKHVCRNVWTLRKFLDMRHNKTEDLIDAYEAETGREFVEEETAMGVFGFPERKGHEQDYRPPYLRDSLGGT